MSTYGRFLREHFKRYDFVYLLLTVMLSIIIPISIGVRWANSEAAKVVVKVTHHLPSGDKSWVTTRDKIHESTRGSIRFSDYDGREIVITGNASIVQLYRMDDPEMVQLANTLEKK